MNNCSIKEVIFQHNDVEIISTSQEGIGERLVTKILAKSKKPKPPEYCKKCGCANEFERKDYYDRKITTRKIYDESITIIFRQLRFRCKVCGSTENEVLDFVDKSARVSNELKKHVVDEIKMEHTFTDVSYNNDISPTTVQKIYEQNINVQRLPFSKTLCFDEFRGPAEKGKFPFIIVNPYTSEIIDIVLSRDHNYLYNYFSKVPIEERESVEYIVTDLTVNYVSVIRSCFPNAKHIADRFHWIRIIIKAVQDIRIEAMKYHLNCAKAEAEQNAINSKVKIAAMKSSEHFKIYHTLKKYHRLLEYNIFDNDYPNLLEGKKKLYKENESKTLQEILEYMINKDEDLQEAYTLLQDLNTIAFSATIDTARKEINKWIEKVETSTKRINPLKNAVKTIKTWRTPIVNSFIIDEEKVGLQSNGCCEAKNNTVKTIIKLGSGYKKPALLRAVVLGADRERIKRKNEEKNKRYNTYIRKNSK